MYKKAIVTTSQNIEISSIAKTFLFRDPIKFSSAVRVTECFMALSTSQGNGEVRIEYRLLKSIPGIPGEQIRFT
jgi:hypothetical protein